MVGLRGAGMKSVMWCLQRSLYGGSAWSWNEERGQFYYHYYAADAPDLNHRSTFVRQEMVVSRTYTSLCSYKLSMEDVLSNLIG